jgi:hypothetical protein
MWESLSVTWGRYVVLSGFDPHTITLTAMI